MSFLFNMRFHLHVYIQQSPSHIWVLAFMELQGFSVGHEEVLLALTYKFFHLPQYVQTYEFGLYYVILITLFCHLYLIWDFTYTCVSNNLSLIFEYLPLCGLQGFSVGHEKVLPALISFFCLPICHLLAFSTSSLETICQPRMLIHENWPALPCS